MTRSTARDWKLVALAFLTLASAPRLSGQTPKAGPVKATNAYETTIT